MGDRGGPSGGNDLGSFLRARRAALDPRRAGLSDNGRQRRVPMWVPPGELAAPAKRPARVGGRRSSASGLNTTEIREWAKSQGIDVKDRGRIPAELVVKFKAAVGA